MPEMNPLLVEVVRQRLVSIAEEGEAVILRTAYSATIAEAADFALAIFDTEMRLLAQSSRALGSFIGTLAFGLRNLLSYFPPDTLRPGDTLITNDPWLGAGHLPDIIAIRPVFAGGNIVAYAANVAHVSDIGGKPSAEGEDVFEEGLLIPPCKLYEEGELNQLVLSFIRANSRLPLQVAGDVQALNAANVAVERRIQAMLVEYHLADLSEISDDLQRRAERAVRSRIVGLPDGDYVGEAFSDGADSPLKICVRITIAGDSITVDYSGTSDQVPWGLNVPFNLTYAETLYALRLAIAPDIPAVEGAIVPFTVTAPEGSVLNPRRPAATMIRVTVVQNVFAAIFSALESIVGEHIPLNNVHAHFGGIWAIRFLGSYYQIPTAYAHGGPPQISTTFAEAYFFNGGAGALGALDGLSAASMPVNCAAIPVEIMEARTPIMFDHKRLVIDSGGPGEFRGGLGQEIAVRVLSDLPIKFVPGTNDRVDHPPVGLFGGKPGRGGGMWIDDQPASRRKAASVKLDQVITVAIPGGGGSGSADRRSRSAVERDIERGQVSAAAAIEDYPSI